VPIDRFVANCLKRQIAEIANRVLSAATRRVALDVFPHRF
jgi:hypothetical protein